MQAKFHSTYFKIVILSFLLFLLSGCDTNKIIEEEKFIEIYTDIIIAKDTVSETTMSKNALIKSILVKYNVTFDEYKTTVEYYNEDSERWEKFFAQAITYLEKKRKDSAK
jgi:hypothetical protein